MPLSEVPPTTIMRQADSATPTIYTDGPGSLTIFESMVKFCLWRDYAELQLDGSTENQPPVVREVAAHVVMSLPTFLRTYAWFGRVIEELKRQGLKYNEEGAEDDAK